MDGGGVSQGNHLIQRDGSSGTITLDPVTEKAINPVSTYQSGYPGGGGDGGGGYPSGGGPGYWDWTGGYGTINFNVSLDPSANPRSVTLHRDGARGETQGSDGTVYGDTIYSYLDYDNNGPDNSTRQIGDYLNWQTFYPTFYGDWHLQQDSPFSWTPTESEDTGAIGKVSMHYRSYNTFEGKPDGGPDATEQRTITYTTTDTDGFIGTANYILTVHDPYEHWIDNNHIIHKNLRRLPFSPSWTSSAGATSGQVYIEQAQTWGGSVSLDGPGDWILGTLGVSLGLDYSFSVNAGASANAGPFPPGYSTWALVYDEYVDYTGTLKLWDAGGFVGTQNYEEQVPNNQIGIQAADPIWTGQGPPPPLH